MSRAQLHRAGGKAAEGFLDAFDQRLTALAQGTGSGRTIGEIEIHLGRRGDGELGEVIDHRGTVLVVQHLALNAVQQVVLKSGLGVRAQPAQTAGDFRLDLRGFTFAAKGADALDFRGPEHVLLLELAADKSAYIAPLRHLAVIGRATFGKRDQ